MPTAPVRLVCLDWGGIIVRICRSWPEACLRAGVPVHASLDTPEGRAARRAIAADYQEGRLTPAQFRDRLSAATDSLYSPGDVQRVHDAFMIQEYPGIPAFIARLASTPHIQTGLLSNTTPDHWARLAPGRLPHFPSAASLRHRHASHLLGHAKPAPEIFRAFEKHTEAPAHEILFFDDMPENVAAARAAGWRAELIDHSGDTAAQMTAHLKAHAVW